MFTDTEPERIRDGLLLSEQPLLLVCKDSTKTAEALIYKGFYGFVFEI